MRYDKLKMQQWTILSILSFCFLSICCKSINIFIGKVLFFFLFCFIQRIFILKLLFWVEKFKIYNINNKKSIQDYILYYDYFDSSNDNHWTLNITDRSKSYRGAINRVYLGDSFMENLSVMQKLFSIFNLTNNSIIIRTSKGKGLDKINMEDCDSLISHYQELLLKQSIWKAFFEVYDEKEELIKVVNFSKNNTMQIMFITEDKDSILAQIPNWIIHEKIS